MADVPSRPSVRFNVPTEEYEAKINVSHPKCKTSARWRAPIPYIISDGDRAKYAKRFIHLPARLAHDGTLARLWRIGEPVSSVLLALAIHAHPAPGAPWTPGIHIDAERLVTLAGQKHRPTVVSALAALREAGIIRQTTRAHPQDGRFRLRTYYVNAGLYAVDGERYFSLEGKLIYSGAWAAMASNAHRHVFITQRLLARVQNPRAFLDALPEGAVAPVQRRITVRELAAASGLSTGGVHKVRSAEGMQLRGEARSELDLRVRSG